MYFVEFVTESNRIEGIHRPPTELEVAATEAFITGDKPTVDSLAELASVYTSGRGKLRTERNMNVRVGSHTPPLGGPEILSALELLIDRIGGYDPFEFHVQYETLHPFMDGNGRTGRALWAWQMFHNGEQGMLGLGFLHAWYYQTLAGSRVKSST